MKQIITLIAVLSFSISYGQTTAIPDANFEQALIDLGYDTGIPDGSVPTQNINTVISLNVENKNISDLTGIEDFDSLLLLDCSNNQLTNLDVSQNTKLWELYCCFDQLTDLVLNPGLVELHCYGNLLTSLDLSQNTFLNILYCAGNLLTHLNVSQNINLLELECGLNLFFDNLVNYITELDLSQNILLKYLNCSYNNLNCLNLKNGNNHNMIEGTYGAFGPTLPVGPGLISINNPNLTCIEVDDTTWATTNWTYIDSQSVFSDDCNNPCYALGIKESSYNVLQVYPNPFLTTTTIDLPSEPHTLFIYDIVGNKVREEQISGKTVIERGDLTKGTYIIEVRSENNTYKGKVLVE